MRKDLLLLSSFHHLVLSREGELAAPAGDSLGMSPHEIPAFPVRAGLLLLSPAAFPPPHEQFLTCCLLLSSGTMSTASW